MLIQGKPTSLNQEPAIFTLDPKERRHQARSFVLGLAGNNLALNETY